MASTPVPTSFEQSQPTLAKKSTSSSRVYSVLRADILQMRLRPGAPLDETELSRQFGVSRAPIREALIRLAGEELAVILANRSTMVAPIEMEQMPRFLDALDLIQRSVTRMAAINRTEAELHAIISAAEHYDSEIRKCVEIGDSLLSIEANRTFHMAIGTASHNAYLGGFYRRLLDESGRLLHLHFEFHTEEPDLNAIMLSDDHHVMVEAIKRRDAEAAERVARDHATQFRGRFMNYLSKNLTSTIRVG